MNRPGCTAAFGNVTTSGPSRAHTSCRSATFQTKPQKLACDTVTCAVLSCPLCGSQAVQRLVTAARLNTGHTEQPADAPQGAASDAAQYVNFDPAKVLRLISRIVENTEDVGRAFPEEVRRIHYKEAPERHIRGTASAKEVSALREEGIDVVSLPVPPHLANKPH